MTKQEFFELAGNGIILLDGATGSNLRKKGMPAGVCTEQWVLEHPDVLYQLQKEYVDAGSQIIYAPTFSANRISFAMYGLENQIEQLIPSLVRLSREAAEGRAYVAGDMTTTGKLLEPRGDLSYQELLDVYKEQADLLIRAGVDLIVAETMMDVEETIVLLDAVQSLCDIPVMCSLTVHADGEALFGGNAVEAVETLQEMGAVAVGLNCSVGPDQLEAVVRSMKAVAAVPVITKPNAGLPFIDEKGEAHYSMGPEEFAVSMEKLIAAGAGVVGGCCGTTPEYIRILKKRIQK